MDWMLFWTAFGAIGGTLGALATFGAIVVALWQTKYAYKKKLKLQFCDNVKIANNSGEIVIELVSLEVTNIGNRDLILHRWGFQIDKHKEIQILSELPMNGIPSHISTAFITKFPYKLEMEHKVTLYYEKKLFVKLLPEHYNNKKALNKHLECFVKDSTGRKYYVKSDKRIKEYMGNQ